MTLFGGFVKVIYFAGAVAAALLVLAVIGAVNQHDKVTTFNAVGDGLVDCFKWGGLLLSKLLALL